MTANAPSQQEPNTPLSRLIDARLEARGMTEEQLLRALGYRDLAKGRRRLSAFRTADGLNGVEHLLKPLARALGVEGFVVGAAIDETRAILHRQAKERYAATFRPHAILKTENTIPRPIFSAAVCHADRWRVIEFEDGMSPVLYVNEVLSNLPEGLPFWGRVHGFWINYTPDRCVEFDRAGNPVRELTEAVRVGTTKSRVGSRLPV